MMLVLMSTHNIGFYEADAILMSTHNIGFYEEISKIITQLSSNRHLISSAAYRNIPIRVFSVFSSNGIILRYMYHTMVEPLSLNILI